MKSIKLLAAMAIPAMFAACTNEEILTEGPQKMQEVVGAELVGTDISFKALGNEGILSRYAGGNDGFEKEDKLGLAWVTVNNNPTTSQDSTAVQSSTVYANNMFEKAEGEDMFTTKGNIYRGFHFVYAPYVYQESVAEKTFVVNPKQIYGYTDETPDEEADKAWYKILANQFQMSAFHYLTAKDLDANNQLTAQFKMKSPLSRLVVKTTAEGVFTTNPTLKEYPIKSVTFKMEQTTFSHKAKVNAQKLHVWSATCEDNVQALVDSFKVAVVQTESPRKKTITTELEEGLYKVSDKNPRIVTFVLPRKATTNDLTKVTIEVVAGGGKFVIAYDSEATEENSAAWKNNQAIQALVDAYKTGGAFNTGKHNQSVTLNLVLAEEDFVADFTGVNNENWADKVQLANDLGRVNQVFELEKGANIVFSGNNLDENGNMLAPVGGVIVKTVNDKHENGKVTIPAQNDTIQWNKLIDVATNEVRLDVATGAVLKVDSVLTPARIYNYGTICAGPESTVGESGCLINAGRVEVEYGAYVNVGNTKGIIAYTLINKDVEDPSRVQEMIATQTNEHGHANVNTLVIGEDINIDLYAKVDGTQGSTEEGRYNDKVTSTVDPSGELYADLQNVSLEIKGGSVKASHAAVNVAGVTMWGGSINNINITGKLTIEESEVQGLVTSETIGSVEIKGGDNTLNVTTINGDVTAKGENDLTVKTINGNVNFENTSTTATNIVGATITGDVTLKGEILLDNVTIEKDLTVTSGNVKTINLAVGGTLTNNGSVVLQSESSINIGSLVNNATLTSNNDINVTNVTLNVGSETTLDSDSEEVGFDKTIWYTDSYEFKNMTLKGTVKQYNAQLLLDAIETAEDGDVVTLNGDAVLSDDLVIEKSITIDLNGKTISNTESIYNDETSDVWSLISVRGENTVVTIKGNGKVQAKEQDCYAVDVRNGGKVIIEDGEFVGNICAVYVHTGSAEIKGGSYNIQQLCLLEGHTGYDETLNCYDANYANKTASITVTGGSFYKFNPIQENSDSTSGSYIADGYKSVADGDWYNVVEK